MSLLDIYKEKNRNEEWFNDHSSLAKGAAGRMFEYTSTNFRAQKTFTDDFLKFLDIENKPRNMWPKQKDHGQEVHKHLVVNMLQSKLFKKDANELYHRTAKGFAYGEFTNLDIPERNRWLINYLFLLNGYYTNRKNYIIYRVKEDLLGSLLSVDGLTEDLLVQSARDLLGADTLLEAFQSTFFFLHSFYNDSDFLITYLRAPKSEKEDLAKYIEGNLQAKNYVCCISKKYQAGGNFTQNTLFDETKVFLMTLLFILSKDPNLSNIYEIFVSNYSNNISSVTEQAVLNYLYENKNIFDPIFTEILELEELEVIISDRFYSYEEANDSEIESTDIAEDYIDETSEIGKQQIKAVFSKLKKQARIQGGYKCALETINNCSPVYFTAKVTGKNYLELHHLIPREFRNDFSYSIEVLANYVTLCPRCHRQIHLAVDRERKHLLNSLYEERRYRLEIVGLKLDLTGIYEYYKIDP
jgi:hypothetical protein